MFLHSTRRHNAPRITLTSAMDIVIHVTGISIVMAAILFVATMDIITVQTLIVVYLPLMIVVT